MSGLHHRVLDRLDPICAAPGFARNTAGASGMMRRAGTKAVKTPDPIPDFGQNGDSGRTWDATEGVAEFGIGGTNSVLGPRGA